MDNLFWQQPEMEKRPSPLVSIPPFWQEFSRHEGLSMMEKQREKLVPCAADHLLDAAAKLSLGMVASPQCPLPFRPARLIVAPLSRRSQLRVTRDPSEDS